MAGNNLLGKAGETIACEHLSAMGFEILERNWRHGRHELDIVARRGKELVVVEVKTRSIEEQADEAAPVKRGQRSRIIKAANAYVGMTGCLLDVRFDIVSIIIRPGHKPRIQHTPEAFYPRLHDKPF